MYSLVGLTAFASRTIGHYTFEEFDQLVKNRGIVSEFSPYKFRIEKE